MLRYGKFPMGIGNHLKFQVHEPIKLSDREDHIELIAHLEKTISEAVIIE